MDRLRPRGRLPRRTGRGDAARRAVRSAATQDEQGPPVAGREARAHGPAPGARSPPAGPGHPAWALGRPARRPAEGAGPTRPARAAPRPQPAPPPQGPRRVPGRAAHARAHGGRGAACAREPGAGGGRGRMRTGAPRLEACPAQESGAFGPVCFSLASALSISVPASSHFGCGKQSVCRERNAWLRGVE